MIGKSGRTFKNDSIFKFTKSTINSRPGTLATMKYSWMWRLMNTCHSIFGHLSRYDLKYCSLFFFPIKKILLWSLVFFHWPIMWLKKDHLFIFWAGVFHAHLWCMALVIIYFALFCSLTLSLVVRQLDAYGRPALSDLT